MYSWHFLCFTYCFVGDTEYCMYLSSYCFFQWKITWMFLFKSNVYVYRPSDTSPLQSWFLIWLKGVNFFAAFYFAGFFFFLSLFCGNYFLRIEVNPQNPQKLKPAKFSCYTVVLFFSVNTYSKFLSADLLCYKYTVSYNLWPHPAGVGC